MNKQVNVKVDAGVSIGVQEHLWRYIGYDECNYTYIPEGVDLLKKFAALGDAPIISGPISCSVRATAMELINSVPPIFIGKTKKGSRFMILPIMTIS